MPQKSAVVLAILIWTSAQELQGQSTGRVDWDSIAVARSLDRPLEAVGIAPLRQARLPGAREYRITTGAGMMYQPVLILRLLASAASVEGDLVYWIGQPGAGRDGAFVADWMHRIGCADLKQRSDIWACRIPINASRAAALIARVDQGDVTNLREPYRERQVSDGAALLIEHRNDDQYHVVNFHDVRPSTQDPADIRASAIREMLISAPRQ